MFENSISQTPQFPAKYTKIGALLVCLYLFDFNCFCVAGTMKDDLVGEEYMADYLLFTLNKRRRFE